MILKLRNRSQFINCFGFAALLALEGLFNLTLLRGVNDADQNVVAFLVASLAPEENVWSENWDGHDRFVLFEAFGLEPIKTL